MEIRHLELRKCVLIAGMCCPARQLHTVVAPIELETNKYAPKIWAHLAQAFSLALSTRIESL